MALDGNDIKRHLWRDLQAQRDALLAKVDGISERDLRRPRTQSGTNLLGILKHAANVEHGYFGTTFGRNLSDSALITEEQFEVDPQADWYATEDETAADIVDLYLRVQAFADQTIDTLDIETTGTVPWWPERRQQITLGRMLSYVTLDLARHAGQADILREGIDGAVGWRRPDDNVPQGYDWPAYVAKLTEIAERF